MRTLTFILTFGFLINFGQAQTSSKSEPYPRYFKNLMYVGMLSGYANSDAADFNVWARANGYPVVQGNYVPVGFEFVFSTNKGFLGGLEFVGNFRTTREISPNLGSYFGLKLGYHIRTFNRLDLNFMTSLGIGYNNIRFNNTNHLPPNELLDIADARGFDIDQAFLRQVNTLVSPELSLYYVFVKKGNVWQDEHFMLFLKAGLNIQATRGKWKYGQHFNDNNGGSYFDSVEVQNIPNSLGYMYFVRLGIAYKLSFD